MSFETSHRKMVPFLKQRQSLILAKMRIDQNNTPWETSYSIDYKNTTAKIRTHSKAIPTKMIHEIESSRMPKIQKSILKTITNKSMDTKVGNYSLHDNKCTYFLGQDTNNLLWVKARGLEHSAYRLYLSPA